MSEKKRVAGPVLVIVGTILILLVVVLLVSLRRSPVEEKAAARSGEQAGTTSHGGRVHAPAPPSPAIRRAGQGAPLSRAGSAGGPVHSPVEAGAAVGVRPGTAGLVARVTAPAAIPPEIASERDPARRAELMKMHRLTTARVRASMLRRREGMLRASIERARKDGSWSPEKIQQAERDLHDISAGVVEAEENLEQVRKEVGGDIDKGKP